MLKIAKTKLFIIKKDELGAISIGAAIIQLTGKSTTLLIIECIFGVTVAFSNLLIILILLTGRKRLMKARS